MKKLVYGIMLVIIAAGAFFVVHSLSKNNKENKENKENIVEKKEDNNVINDIEFINKQKYIMDNKDKIVSVEGNHVTLGGQECYKLDNTKAYNLFTGIEKVTISNTSMTDNYYTYRFIFNDDSKVVFSFSGPYYEEGSKTYNLIDFKHMVYEETDIIPC